MMFLLDEAIRLAALLTQFKGPTATYQWYSDQLAALAQEFNVASENPCDLLAEFQALRYAALHP